MGRPMAATLRTKVPAGDDDFEKVSAAQHNGRRAHVAQDNVKKDAKTRRDVI